MRTKFDCKKLFHVATLGFCLCLLTRCERSAFEPIIFGEDTCHVCKMTISDKRFGGEIVTELGKTYKFDSVGCMLQHIQSNSAPSRQTLVVDLFKNGELVDASKAFYLISRIARGPMGEAIFASNDKGRLQEVEKSSPLETFSEVLQKSIDEQKRH